MSLPSGPHEWRIPEWFPELGDDKLHQLKTFHGELIQFNGRMNLISPRTERTADLVHFADGIIGCRIVAEACDSDEIWDMGSGNGIPGLVMACLFPERRILPVEADARKVEFLKHVASRMGLQNVAVTHARVEDIEEGSIHCGMTRAMASISKTLLLARKAAAHDCRFFHFKGESWSKEVAEIPSQILAFWEPGHVKAYHLPNGQGDFNIIMTKRI